MQTNQKASFPETSPKSYPGLTNKATNPSQTTLFSILLTLLISGILFGLAGFYFGYQFRTMQQYRYNFTPSDNTSQGAATSSSPTSTETVELDQVYMWGEYGDCLLYSRSNMNTYETNNNMLPDLSEIRCNIMASSQPIVSVTDKQDSPNAKNSVYRFWHDTEGYKILLVDQNGAGSGEGIGKVLLLKERSYHTLSCFYFVWEDFYTVNIQMKTVESLSMQEQETIKKNAIDSSSPYCSNFTLTSIIE